MKYEQVEMAMRHQVRFRSKKVSSAGFTLIEILVTVVILSVGILGFTAMQVSSVSSAVLTRHLDSCSNLTYDAIDRVKSNVGHPLYGSDFSVSPSAGCPGDGSLPDSLCIAMEQMQFDAATLLVTFQLDTPVNLLDTLTATITFTHKGKAMSCTAMDMVNR